MNAVLAEAECPRAVPATATAVVLSGTGTLVVTSGLAGGRVASTVTVPEGDGCEAICISLSSGR